ncbi:hypothetical protein ACX80H_12290 [Arthrobacter sp. MDT2-2]
MYLQQLDVELAKLTDAVAALSPQPRHARWAHLSLCVLDATYSIGLRYKAVVVPLVRRYATEENLTPVLIKGEPLQEQISPREGEQSLTQFAASIENLSDEEFAEALGSRNRTSSRGGILKSAASRSIADILVTNRVEILGDVAELLADAGRTARVEEQLRQVPGAGTQGVRTSYLWMLAGDDQQVKPDRHVLKWIGNVLGRRVPVQEARILLRDVARELDLTAWSIDHAIWLKMSRRGRGLRSGS